MPQINYGANLTNGYLPFLSTLQGRTIIVPRQDNVLTPQEPTLAAQATSDKDRDFPQLLYAHNVLPTKQGLKSLNFKQQLAGLAGHMDFQDVFPIFDSNENKFLLSPGSSGTQYVYDADSGGWIAAANLALPSNGITSIAYINGVTYIHFSGIGIYQYDSTVSKQLIPVALTGIVASALNGICTSNGFLIAWDNFNVYRAQVTNVLNFTPSASTGAGSSIPTDIKGTIIACLPVYDGFLIYCTKNIVGASFQNNIQYPFIYKEVKGSMGIRSLNDIAWTGNLGYHYVLTEAGILQVNRMTAEQVFPDLTDFLVANIFEDFANNTLTQTKLSSPLITKLTLVADRWFVCSYGINTLTHAIIYDITQKRWGKIKLNHTAAFTLFLPNPYGNLTWDQLAPLTWDQLGTTSWAQLASGIATQEQPQQTLAFLQQDGTVQVAALDLNHLADNGVAVFGKYQFLRNNLLCLDGFDIEGVPLGSNFSVVVLSSLDGKTNLPPAVPYQDLAVDGLVSYLCSIEALNHSIACMGTFNLTALTLGFHLAGRL